MDKTGAKLGAELSAEAIAKSMALPLKPTAVTLVGKYIKLVPIDLQRDNEALTSCKLAAFLFAQEKAENGLCFCVFDLAADKQIGVVNYLNNFPAHLKVELGNIWYSPLVQRTKVNLEATYLLLQHAFNLGYRRVEWKCDALNLRSSKAALRMGFKFEGIQESHFIIKGRNRDIAWFRILDAEWTGVQKLLHSLLEKEE